MKRKVISCYCSVSIFIFAATNLKNQFKTTMTLFTFRRCNLSLIISLAVFLKCAKNLTVIHHGIHSFSLHPFTNTTYAKNMDMFSSRLTSNSVKMQQMCYHSFLSKLLEGANVIETILFFVSVRV